MVTVIIPVYNGGRFLAEAIESILHQSYTDIELVIVNDGSTDETEAIVRRYLQISEVPVKIHYLVQSNRGKAAAVNNALQQAQGGYVTILDHDDIFPRTSIEKRVLLLETNPACVAVYGDAFLIDGKNRIYGKKKSRPVAAVADLLGFFRNPIASCSIMFRRKAVEHIGNFDERIRRLDDVDRNICLFLTGPLFYAPEPFSYSRTYRRRGSLSLRIITVSEFALLTKKYLPNPSRTYIYFKQIFFQVIKSMLECLTWRK